MEEPLTYEVIEVDERSVTFRRDFSGLVSTVPRLCFPEDVAVGEKYELTTMREDGLPIMKRKEEQNEL